MLSYLAFSPNTGKIPIQHFLVFVSSKTKVPHTQFCASRIFPPRPRGRGLNFVECPYVTSHQVWLLSALIFRTRPICFRAWPRPLNEIRNHSWNGNYLQSRSYLLDVWSPVRAMFLHFKAIATRGMPSASGQWFNIDASEYTQTSPKPVSQCGPLIAPFHSRQPWKHTRRPLQLSRLSSKPVIFYHMHHQALKEQ